MRSHGRRGGPGVRTGRAVGRWWCGAAGRREVRRVRLRLDGWRPDRAVRTTPRDGPPVHHPRDQSDRRPRPPPPPVHHPRDQSDRRPGMRGRLLSGRPRPHHRTRMPRAKPPATRTASPHDGVGSEAVNAVVARTAPAVLELLADGVPRSKAAIAEALAGRHAKDDVVHTLIRLAVTGQVVDTGGKYALASSEP